MEDMQQLYPAVVILKPKFPCEQELRTKVHSWITRARLEQKYHTLPWEMYGDMLLVDSIISSESCWVGFDEYGQLNTENGIVRTHGLNIFHNDLPDILKRAFPRQKGTN